MPSRNAAACLAVGPLEIDADTVEQALQRTAHTRSVLLSRDGLAEQQKIADAFVAEGVLPKKIETTDVTIWSPK